MKPAVRVPSWCLWPSKCWVGRRVVEKINPDDILLRSCCEMYCVINGRKGIGKVFFLFLTKLYGHCILGITFLRSPDSERSSVFRKAHPTACFVIRSLSVRLPATLPACFLMVVNDGGKLRAIPFIPCTSLNNWIDLSMARKSKWLSCQCLCTVYFY